MTTEARYTLYHPKWYRRPVSVWWWLSSWRYMKFVLRELTSVPVAIFSLLTLWQVPLSRERARSLRPFRDVDVVFSRHRAQRSDLRCRLVSRADVVPSGPQGDGSSSLGKTRSDLLIIVSNYIGWVVVSAVVAWFWLGR